VTLFERTHYFGPSTKFQRKEKINQLLIFYIAQILFYWGVKSTNIPKYGVFGFETYIFIIVTMRTKVPTPKNVIFQNMKSII